jgi:multiple sugar transport system ATP-binding protein
MARRAVSVPATQAACSRVVLGVRPEHVRLRGADQGSLGGRVQHVEYFGSHWVAEVQTDAGVVKVLAEKSVRPVLQERVGLEFETERVVLFDAATERLLPSATTVRHQPGMRHG